MKKKTQLKTHRRKKSTSFKLHGSGTFFVFILVALLIVAAATIVGGLPRMGPLSKDNPVIAVTPPQENAKSNLQLQTFGYITPIPTPTSALSLELCQDGGVNNEPEILVGYQPASGLTVAGNGQIKVWVNDEGAPFIAPNEQVDLTTGQIITPGDRGAKADDNYLFEPSLYIAPNTIESGGTPYFPTLIKGKFSNTPQTRDSVIVGAPIDPIPGGAREEEDYTAEFIWDVSSLGKPAGSYQAEFVIHDGDVDLGIGCINFTIE